MNDKINKAAIIQYMNDINPQNPLEVLKVSSEIKELSAALLLLVERINAPRQVKLWQEENAQLQQQVTQLTSDIKKAKQLDDSYQELSKQREDLLAQKAMIGDLSGQKEEILKLKAFVAEYNIAALQQELQTLRADATGDILLIQEWITAANRFFFELQGTFFKEVQGLLGQLEQNRQQVAESVNKAGHQLKLDYIEFSNLLQNYDGDLKSLQVQYNEVANQLNAIKLKLTEIKKNHAKNVQGYEAHFAQNKEIWGELGKRHHIDEHLTTLFTDIEKKLSHFDQEIKTLVEKADHLVVF